MSVFFQRSVSQWNFVNKINKNCKLKNFHIQKCLNSSASVTSGEASLESTEQQFVPFLDVINLRREEARRSIIVQVQSAKSFKELHNYCNSLGSIKHMLHYKCGVEPLHFIIVEFASEADAQNVIKSSTFVQESNIVPVPSSFMWLRASAKKAVKLKSSKNIDLRIENGTDIIEDKKIREHLRNCDNMDTQIKCLYDITKLNDVGSRLRFLTAKQIEIGLEGLFPNATALPFGSSVNGFGKINCDLDLVLRLQNENLVSSKSRLIFHCKATNGSERSVAQRHMEAIGDLIHLFLPGCTHVRKILQARVPIIKYHQQLTDVECDLSLSNISGVCMSDFLYLMGFIDARVKPLIFTVRKWASEVGLTNSSPGRWITNFSLTLLVLAFLQNPLASPPVLPSLNTLVKQAGPDDKHVTEEGLDCTFLRNINNLNFKSDNTESTESLLQQFFEYYSHFDFSTKAVCLNESISITKPDHSPLYIINPLERGLNVSKNVSLEELERFKTEVKNAAWALESQESQTSEWGILRLFDSSKKAAAFPSIISMSTRQGRLMDVSKLFEEEQNDAPREYKNQHVKSQVEKIKESTEKTIKELESKSLKNR